MKGRLETDAGPLEVSPARHADLRGLVELLGASVPDCIPQTVWELPWTWHHYRVVRTPEGRIVGAGSLQPLPRRRAEVRGLTVARGWRGHGIARTLLHDLIERAERQGLEVVCVTRSPDFFARFGFHDTSPSWLDTHHRRSIPTNEQAKRRIAMSRPPEVCS